jgi:hypothetical protein
MSFDNPYPAYHSPTPNRQAFMSQYSQQPYPPQPLSTSPSQYNPNEGGFVPINQPYSANQAVPILGGSPAGFSLASDPIAIPQASFPGSSPPGHQLNYADFFTTGDQMNMGGAPYNFPQQLQEDWTNMLNPQPTSFSWGSNGNLWDGAVEMQPAYSSQGQDVSTPMNERRGSMYFPPVIPL